MTAPRGGYVVSAGFADVVAARLDAHDVTYTRLTDAVEADVEAFLKKDDDDGYVECSNAVLAHFLDGLVIHRRGRNPDLPARPVEKHVNNNVVLKKLRVAFELKDVDMHEIFDAAGFPISKPELSGS